MVNMVSAISINNKGYFIDLMFYIRNELIFCKCLKILKKYKSDMLLHSLKIIRLCGLKSNHILEPFTTTFNMLFHFLSYQRVVICQRITQRFSFAHCAVTWHL